jgi:sulfite reductase alpha subunit-like flavoprotein
VEELESQVSSGRILRMDWVYSREAHGDARPRRIPRFLEDNAAEVRRWIGMGAHFYLCGLAALKTDVRSVLEGILAQENLASPGLTAGQTLDAWERERRLQASVSGGQGA